ncbi:MAG: membrane protein insertion efficiency factor YidD [Candidatus Binataceae bacterium]
MIETVSERLGAAALAAALGAVAAYRWLISPLLMATAGPACRFEPTCSEYAHQALAAHGLGRGLNLTLRRLLRCRPMGGWGYDPVPAPAHRTRSPQHP